MKEKTYENGQRVSDQKGDTLTYYFKTGIVRARGTSREYRETFADGKLVRK